MTGSLFDDLPEPPSPEPSKPPPDAPLAERLRPRTLDEMVGQEAVAGPEGVLRRAMSEDRVPSLVLWGPPGTGKTTIARILARETSARFVAASAVTSGVKEIRAILEEAVRLRRAGKRTVLFVDEIHRFNRTQQDAFLPSVESGDVTLVGATTENPSFELTSALLSRCQVVVLAPLDRNALVTLVRRALADRERGLGDSGVDLAEGAVEAVVRMAAGDARRALNLLESVVADVGSREGATATEEDVERVAQRQVFLYDKAGESHYDLISALHKSIRESDVDAALYWLCRMLAGGEDPLYLARRLVRIASEDVGLADPDALHRTLAAWDAYHRLGSPEGELALAQAAVALALAPKSDSVYRAFGAVKKAVEETADAPVPLAVRNAPTGLMRDLGYGEGYESAHRAVGEIAGVECLPEVLRGRRFFEPGTAGEEERVRERWEALRREREEARRARGEEGGEG